MMGFIQTTFNPVADCPVKEQAERTVKSGREFVRAIRKLKRLMEHCATCPIDGECLVPQSFNQSITTALQEISEEWTIPLPN